MTSSSRLVVKNLPPNITEDKLRNHLKSKGNVTDLKLQYLPDGNFRHFAYVGYKTSEEADVVRDYFNNTFIGSVRIKVETWFPKDHPERPKPWSKKINEGLKEEQKERLKRKKKEIEESRPKKNKKEDEILEKAAHDADFKEFLQVHNQGKAKWGNDALQESIEKVSISKQQKLDPEIYEGDPDSDESSDEEVNSPVVKDKVKSDSKGKGKKDKIKKPLVEFYTLKIRNIPKKAKKNDIKKFFSPLVPDSVRLPKNLRGFAFVGFKDEKDYKKALNKDKSILIGQQVRVKEHVNENKTEGEDGGGGSKKIKKTKNQTLWDEKRTELDQETEDVGESGRIYVRNLAFSTKEEDIRELFEPYGTLTEVHLPIDRITRQNKGFAFVTFFMPSDAKKAFPLLDRTSFQGRVIHLLPAKDKESENSFGSKAKSSYKRDKEIDLKKNAGSGKNWNTLFINQTALEDITASKFGVSREQLLINNYDDDPEDSKRRLETPAVRMAMAETQVVADVETFLKKNGVCLEAFDELANADNDIKKKGIQRSTTTILVRNLTADIMDEEIRERFQKYGVIEKVLLPPFGVTAIVQFAEPAEARNGFKNVAYSKLKGIPMYLEWAPVGVFDSSLPKNKRIVTLSKSEESNKKEDSLSISLGDNKTIIDKSSLSKQTPSTEEFVLPTVGDDDEDEYDYKIPEPETTLFVKNISFKTNEDQLKRIFAQCGKVYAATIAKKKDPANPAELLSQGYGFVQYYKANHAANALLLLQKRMVDNHQLELKTSQKTLFNEKETESTNTSEKMTNILVRNVPFQASVEEVGDLFKIFGKLKGVRMPNKLLGENQHRGFGFVEFFSEDHAKAAMNSLGKSCHLYGRRLNLSWAKKDDSVEALREKIDKRYGAVKGSNTGSNSTKKGIQRYFDTQGKKKQVESDGEED